jgi:hypothetical protein
MAEVVSADGYATVNVPDASLSDPKFKTATAAPVVLLYIKAPLVIKLAEVHTVFTKDTYAVVPLLAGGTTTKVLPPAVYPEPTTSLLEVYTRVDASKEALALYNAILYVYGVPTAKFSKPLKQFFLNIVHCVCTIAIMD